MPNLFLFASLYDNMKRSNRFNVQKQSRKVGVTVADKHDRSERQAIAEKHIATMNAVFYNETENTFVNKRHYKDGDMFDSSCAEPKFDDTEIVVDKTDSVSALVAQNGNVAVLDSASFLYAGGGYANGGYFQEESLCEESNLYNILLKCKKDFYNPHRSYRRGELYTADAMFLPQVKFVRNGNIRDAGVIVIAPPNARRAIENNRGREEIDADMRRRVFSAMNIAVDNDVETLVIGAFGCDARNGNDPGRVATFFREWLSDHNGALRKVVFAMPYSYQDNIYRAFEDVLVFGNDASMPEPPECYATDDQAAATLSELLSEI